MSMRLLYTPVHGFFGTGAFQRRLPMGASAYGMFIYRAWPFWLIVGLGIGAMALLVGGIAAVVAGAGLLAVMTGTGIMTIGIGCLMIALAILMILGLISIAVRIVPKWFRKITDFFNRVLYRKRKEEVK